MRLELPAPHFASAEKLLSRRRDPGAHDVYSRRPNLRRTVVYAHPDDPTYALVLRGNPEPAEGSATTGPEKRSAVELTEVVDEEMITGAYRPVRVMFYPHSGCAFSAEPNLLGE